jgi:PAS domain S-box-containing protein
VSLTTIRLLETKQWPPRQSDKASGPISSKTLRQRAEEMARTSPTDIAGMTSNEVQRLIHELQIHQIELELQNEELRQAQVELAHSRDQYSDLYEFAPTGYVTLDSDGKIQNANLTTAAMLGVERQHLLQASLSNFVNRESQDEFYLHRRAVLSSETKQTCEVRMKGADARGLAVRLESIAFGPENDRRCRTALIDLTAERQAQQQLQESEQRYRRLTDTVTDYIYRVRVEHGRSVETIHGANCEAVTGYTPEEFDANRMLWIAMVPPEDRALVERQAACILSGQEAPPIEHRIRRKDGQINWVLNTVSPERDDQGHLIAYDGLLRDITKRKVAEETLRLLNIDLGKSLADRTGELQQNIKQVKLLTEAVSHLGEGVLITSDKLDWPGPHIVFVNDAMCQITGYTAEELIGQSPRVLQGDDSNRETLDRIKAELSAGRSVLAEVINYRKDGTPYDAELFITPMYNAEGRRTNFVSVHRDITERKRAEQQLRESTEQLRAVLGCDTAADAIITIDQRGIINGEERVEYGNRTACSATHTEGTDWSEREHPDAGAVP